MKPIGEEQQEVASALNDRAVVDYLLQHPEFFIRNAAQVEHLRVPHPVRGTISLVEWHMMRARNHIHVLEENMSLLMEQAVANESLFQRLLRCSLLPPRLCRWRTLKIRDRAHIDVYHIQPAA